MAEDVEGQWDQDISEQAKKAMDIAQKIGEAIAKKFPKHQLFVRRYDLSQGGEAGYIEIALRPENGSRGQEITVNYADEYFLGAAGTEMKARAQQIYAEFKVHFNIK